MAAVSEYPELGNGFTGPSEFVRVPVPGPGNYRVRAVLGGWTEPVSLTVFLGRRRCVAAGLAAVPGQEVVIDRTEAVGPIVPRGLEEPREVEAVFVTVPGGPWVRSVEVTPAPGTPTIHLAGDSTVTDQSAEWPWNPADTYCGWGQMLPLFLAGDVAVSNHAHSGLTTESFRTGGHWALMKAALRPGDLALFQFGHNDQKILALAADRGYRDNLVAYIGEVRALGAEPVLVSPVSRSVWNGPGGSFHDLLTDQARVCQALALELSVPLVDLHGASVDRILGWGAEGAKAYFHSGDYTHHNDFGGREMAALVAAGLREVLANRGAWWNPVEPGHFPRTPGTSVSVAVPAPAGPAVSRSTRTDGPLTRVDWLVRLMGAARILPCPVYNDAFDDIFGDEWYAGSVQAGADHGLWDPVLTPERVFGPLEPVTGADLADMAARALRFKGDTAVAATDFDPGLDPGSPADGEAAERILAQLAGRLGLR